MIKIQSDYHKRPIRFIELWEDGGWSLKVYGISYLSDYPSNKLIDTSKELARDTLPFPAVTNNRYGLGFIGVHEGSGANFIFVDWWSNEIELKILALALEKAKELNLDKVLLVCHSSNTASKKVIINNGGIWDKDFVDKQKNTLNRFWIELK
ncbi:GNAT family N-acetyltransferase [Halobacillus sp. A5]|uniref:GNAT family N-acetyltransferase n=1 Tax=Halobacillus sp. A5 TaxID=2880263 RepID=UPI0020A68788|nr:hypothetical protein [Halobacillus sp. A5]MCP3027713.1 hypothetical protein [Halobacillus sp. A5]